MALGRLLPAAPAPGPGKNTASQRFRLSGEPHLSAATSYT